MARAAAHRIKRHQVYTVHEAADALGRHPRTVRRWIKSEGLPADQSRRPWLIRGDELKTWLEARREETRTRLGPVEVWCLPCRQPVRPAGDMAEYRAQTETLGFLTGICPSCERLVHRAVRASDLHRFAAKLDVTRA